MFAHFVVVDVRVDQSDRPVQPQQFFGTDSRGPPAQTKLREARAGTHQNRKRPRRYFGIERSVITTLDEIEPPLKVLADASAAMTAKRAPGLLSGP